MSDPDPPWLNYTPPPRLEEFEALASDPPSPGILPYDLGRRGFWALEPGKSVQLELPVEDVMGTVIVWEAPLGRISVADLQVAVALSAIWGEGARERVFEFTLADLAERLELAWGGKTAKQLDRALLRLRSTTFGITWREASGHSEHDDRFGIIDSYRLSGRRGGRRHSGQVEWSRWTYGRLDNRHFSLIDLATLKSIESWIAKRLYAYCESMTGHPWMTDEGERRERFQRRIDDSLKGTLGCRAGRELRFLRADLKKAGEEICRRDSRYREITVRPGKVRGSHLLAVERLRR